MDSLLPSLIGLSLRPAPVAAPASKGQQRPTAAQAEPMRLLSALPPDMRRAIELKLFEGYEVESICNILHQYFSRTDRENKNANSDRYEVNYRDVIGRLFCVVELEERGVAPPANPMRLPRMFGTWKHLFELLCGAVITMQRDGTTDFGALQVQASEVLNPFASPRQLSAALRALIARVLRREDFAAWHRANTSFGPPWIGGMIADRAETYGDEFANDTAWFAPGKTSVIELQERAWYWVLTQRGATSASPSWHEEDDEDDELRDTVRGKNVERVHQLLRDGADVNRPDTLLMAAFDTPVALGSEGAAAEVRILELLVRYGIQLPEADDPDGPNAMGMGILDMELAQPPRPLAHTIARFRALSEGLTAATIDDLNSQASFAHLTDAEYNELDTVLKNMALRDRERAAIWGGRDARRRYPDSANGYRDDAIARARARGQI